MGVMHEIGRHGEQVVARRLADDGWEVLARNWRCRMGELDLICADGSTAVAVEVKTRRAGGGAGGPLEAVTPAKVARLRRLLVAWLDQQERTFEAVRVDVVGVTLPHSGAAVLDHVRGVE